MMNNPSKCYQICQIYVTSYTLNVSKKLSSVLLGNFHSIFPKLHPWILITFSILFNPFHLTFSPSTHHKFPNKLKLQEISLTSALKCNSIQQIHILISSTRTMNCFPPLTLLLVWNISSHYSHSTVDIYHFHVLLAPDTYHDCGTKLRESFCLQLTSQWLMTTSTSCSKTRRWNRRKRHGEEWERRKEQKGNCKSCKCHWVYVRRN